jgi:hypothetical protein
MKKKKRTTRSKADKVPKNLGQRPEAYRKVYANMAYKLCLLNKGTTDKDLAYFFNVSEATINNWKLKHPKFLESIQKGKTPADMEIAKKLHDRASGYSHPEDKIFAHLIDTKTRDEDGNEVTTQTVKITVVPTIKHYPPDYNSMRLWLLNRTDFRDKLEQVMSGKVILEPPEIT